MRSRPTSHLLLLALSVALFLPSCLFGTKKHTETSGTYVSSQTFGHIELGQSEEFVTGLLGEPDSKLSQSGEGGESVIWKWSYSSETESRGSVFLVASSSTTTNSSGRTFVEFKEGKVSKAWRD
ncbi:MAG: hypothetical protein ACI9F9_001731 [Candidatus Paceibacteria bacterium]|jgi:hypothetical protein